MNVNSKEKAYIDEVFEVAQEYEVKDLYSFYLGLCYKYQSDYESGALTLKDYRKIQCYLLNKTVAADKVKKAVNKE